MYIIHYLTIHFYTLALLYIFYFQILIDKVYNKYYFY